MVIDLRHSMCLSSKSTACAIIYQFWWKLNYLNTLKRVRWWWYTNFGLFYWNRSRSVVFNCAFSLIKHIYSYYIYCRLASYLNWTVDNYRFHFKLFSLRKTLQHSCSWIKFYGVFLIQWYLKDWTWITAFTNLRIIKIV